MKKIKRRKHAILGVLIVCVLCVLLYSTGLYSSSHGLEQADDITVEDVVAKYLEAVGGADALKKISAKTVRYRVHMFGRDSYVMERKWERPDRMRTGRPDAPVHTVTEGTRSWRITPDGRTELPAAVSASFAKKADIDGPLVDPDKKGISLEYLGIERFDMSELHPHSASAFLDHLFQATSISDIVIMRCVLNQS